MNNNDITKKRRSNGIFLISFSLLLLVASVMLLFATLSFVKQNQLPRQTIYPTQTAPQTDNYTAFEQQVTPISINNPQDVTKTLRLVSTTSSLSADLQILKKDAAPLLH